jgi:hypothetical protein
MESIELQKFFFQHVKTKLNNHLSFVEEIADVLTISTDSAYRRIRGEKPISFEEIQKICKKYRISLDHILSLDTNSTVFYGNWIGTENFNFERYLQDMLLQLETIASSEKKILFYETKDIPPFHHFQFTELANFKYFFWMKTILAYPEYNKMYYEDCDLKETIQKTGTEIIKTYVKIPSVEVWSAETITSSIHQIEFYRDSGIFKKKETISLIYQELMKLVNHIEAEAEAGEKFLYGKEPGGNKDNLNMYFNEVFLGHNTIYAEAGDSRTVFINHGVLNYMITRDKHFCESTKKSLENTIRKSSLISIINEKERHRYFRMLRNKIEAVNV